MTQVHTPTIDVVIPAHKKDLDTLNHVISGIRKHGVGVRRIIVVSKEKYSDKAEWFDESLYPFGFQEIGELVNNESTGWHFQQLLKMYAPLVIPDISENVLILDADTVFLKKVHFFNDDGLPLYNLCKDKDLADSPFQEITFEHIQKKLPDIEKHFPKEFKNVSGICHHMIFQKHMIEDLFSRVESYDKEGDPFYKVFLKDRKEGHGVAEYNLYFYFLISLHPNSYKIRKLAYKNTADLNVWKYKLRTKYNYCSFHSYMRKDKKKSIFGKIFK